MGSSKGGGGGSAPQAPNPSDVIAQQSAANVNTAVAQAYLNNVNQKTPWGDLNYDVTGHQTVGGNDVPTFTASQSLTPAGQKLLDTNMATTQGTADLANSYVSRIADATSKPFSYDGLPAAPVYDEAFRQHALDSIISRNQPQMDRDRDALTQQLANQGIPIGSAAYQAAMDQYQRGVNDFRLGADQQSMAEAGNEYSLAANSRDRAIQEMANLRTEPINEVGALLGTGTPAKGPSFVNTPQTTVAPTDVAGIYANNFAGQMAGYNSQLQANSAAMGGLFGLGGAVLGGGLRSTWLGSLFGAGGGGGGGGYGPPGFGGYSPAEFAAFAL